MSAKKAAKKATTKTAPKADSPSGNIQRRSGTTRISEPVRPIHTRSDFESKLELFRGVHVFIGEDHCGWFVNNSLLVLRPEFVDGGFQEHIKAQIMRHFGRPVTKVEFSTVRPMFTVEEANTRLSVPREITDAADPMLGDLDPCIIAFYRKNLTTEEFQTRYGDRVQMKKTDPKRHSDIEIVPTAIVIPSGSPTGADGFLDKDPEITDNPVDVADYDDGRENNGKTEDELAREAADIDSGSGGEDADGFLDEDPPEED